MDLTDQQLQRVTNRLSRDIEEHLRDRTVEVHYSAEAAAEILHVSVRTIWNYVKLGERTRGREGIHPVAKLSHKVVRIPASAINRFLKARMVATSAEQLHEANV
jgi:hypothetical protein